MSSSIEKAKQALLQSLNIGYELDPVAIQRANQIAEHSGLAFRSALDNLKVTSDSSQKKAKSKGKSAVDHLLAKKKPSVAHAAVNDAVNHAVLVKGLGRVSLQDAVTRLLEYGPEVLVKAGLAYHEITKVDS